MQPLGRQAAFFSVVHALTQRLRSVFVPYFRYVLDTAVGHLAGEAPVQPHAKKKRKKSKAADVAAGAVSADAGLANDAWLLRFRVGKAGNMHGIKQCMWCKAQ
jgi:U3 small nucleolar RNA-associated protein 10